LLQQSNPVLTMTPSPPLLQITDLCIEFPAPQGSVKAVDMISFTLQQGEAVAIVGESGSGKTLMALSLMQLLPSAALQRTGQAEFQSAHWGPIDLYQLGPRDLQKVRGKEIAVIFQEPMSSLNPVISCGKQVAEALLLHYRISKEEAYQRTLAIFELVKLPTPERIFKSFPHELSGGQKQRVMLAMAMSCDPAILIADEPTTALDVTVQASILQLLNELRQQKEMSLLFISHDLSVVGQVADRVLVMYQGKIVEEGTVQQIFADPQHPYTKALLACRPTMNTQGTVLPTVADFMKTTDAVPSRKEQQIASGNLPRQQEGRVDNPYFQRAKVQDSTVQDPILQVQNLQVEFTRGRNFFWQPKEVVKAVNGVSFDVFPQETIAIVGESGCGKTTLGRALLRLIEPSGGKVVFNGQDWSTLPEQEIRKQRKEFQIIFQDPQASLNPLMKIGKAIMEPMQVHKVLKNDRERKQRVLELLETVNLLPEHFNRYPHEFSGGQQQRICIARALALEPTCIICDEIVSALDVSVQAQVLNLLNRLKQQFKLTILFITHDLAVARFMADRVFVMDQGMIVEQGTAQEIFQHPKHPFTKALVQAIPSAEIPDILATQRKRNTYKASIDE
jgi:peptide/nickel transport system ATP-binding protein